MLAKIGMTLTFLLVCHGPIGAQAAPAPLAVVWQHFGLSLPAGYCVQYQQGPDFVVRYLRAGDSKGPILAGIYTGYAPSFSPDCKPATRRTSTTKGLKLESVEGSDSCAEFLVSDPASRDRGFLHLWFGPDAKSHPGLAHALVDSISPAPLDAASSEGPACN
jgi:hypothetical protein